MINHFTITPAKAESMVPTVHSILETENSTSLLANQNEQDAVEVKKKEIADMNQKIQENYHAMVQLENDINNNQSQISQLEEEISNIKEKIENRNEILKERVRSIQHSGGNISYLEVLLNAKDFGEFIERVSSVTKVVQADQDLLDQQNTDIEELEKKQLALMDKLNEQDQKKSQYEQLITYLHDQNSKNIAEIKHSQNKKESDHTDTSDIEASFAIGHGYKKTIITAGYKYIGNSVYVFGGGRTESDIANGRFDCSSFVNWAFGQAGIEIGSTTDSIKNEGRQVAESDIQPGDLVFFDTYKKDGHVGIYIGNGNFIGSQSSTGVAIADMTNGYWQDKFNGRIIRIVD